MMYVYSWQQGSEELFAVDPLPPRNSEDDHGSADGTQSSYVPPSSPPPSYPAPASPPPSYSQLDMAASSQGQREDEHIAGDREVDEVEVVVGGDEDDEQHHDQPEVPAQSEQEDEVGNER